MESHAVNDLITAYRSIPRMKPMLNGRSDPQLARALEHVPPQSIEKAKATSEDFEAMFLNSMFSQMTSGLKGEGPFGDTPGTGVWRSMLTEQYSRSFAKAGGVGVSDAVFRALIMQQASQTKPSSKESA
jgi:Rod binding domain-containing protein